MEIVLARLIRYGAKTHFEVTNFSRNPHRCEIVSDHARICTIPPKAQERFQ